MNGTSSEGSRRAEAQGVDVERRRSLVTRAHQLFVELGMAIIRNTKTRPITTDMSTPFLMAFRAMWADARPESRSLCMYLLFWMRAPRGGIGLRGAFRSVLAWLACEAPDGRRHLVDGLRLIPSLGRWDDLKALFGTPLERAAAQLWAEAIRAADPLACKWAKVDMVPLQRAIRGNERDLRKLTVPGRPQILERRMCARQWATIDYQKLSQSHITFYRSVWRRRGNRRQLDVLARREDEARLTPWTAGLSRAARLMVSPDQKTQILRCALSEAVLGELGLFDCDSDRAEGHREQHIAVSTPDPLVAMASGHADIWNEKLALRRDCRLKSVQHIAYGLDKAVTADDLQSHFSCNADVVRRALARLRSGHAAQSDPALLQFIDAALARVRRFRPSEAQQSSQPTRGGR